VRRHEAVALLAFAVLLVVAGSVWLFGPFGLLGSGVVLIVVTLFALDIKDGDREAVGSTPRR
jgi:predicted PurR-regulated permease PerM